MSSLVKFIDTDGDPLALDARHVSYVMPCFVADDPPKRIPGQYLIGTIGPDGEEQWFVFGEFDEIVDEINQARRELEEWQQ